MFKSFVVVGCFLFLLLFCLFVVVLFTSKASLGLFFGGGEGGWGGTGWGGGGGDQYGMYEHGTLTTGRIT